MRPQANGGLSHSRASAQHAAGSAVLLPTLRTGAVMPEHVYKVVELVGSSEQSLTEAIDRAVAKASETLRNIGWFEVTNIRGHVENGKVAHYQVTLKLGFTVEE
jgi:dodecin